MKLLAKVHGRLMERLASGGGPKVQLIPGRAALEAAVGIFAQTYRERTTLARRAVPVEGKPFDATLAKAEQGWKLSFGVGDQHRDLPAADLVVWGAFVEATRGPQLLLAGGGLVVADVLEINKESLRAESD